MWDNLLFISPGLDSYLVICSNNLVEEREQPKIGYKSTLAGEVGQPLLYLLGWAGRVLKCWEADRGSCLLECWEIGRGSCLLECWEQAEVSIYSSTESGPWCLFTRALSVGPGGIYTSVLGIEN